jgi:hypothetical protein
MEGSSHQWANSLGMADPHHVLSLDRLCVIKTASRTSQTLHILYKFHTTLLQMNSSVSQTSALVHHKLLLLYQTFLQLNAIMTMNITTIINSSHIYIWLTGFKDSVNVHNVNPEVPFHAAFIHKFITAR